MLDKILSLIGLIHLSIVFVSKGTCFHRTVQTPIFHPIFILYLAGYFFVTFFRIKVLNERVQ